MTRGRIALLGAVAIVATALLLGGAFHEPSSAGYSAPSPAEAVSSLQTGFAAGNTATLVANLQAALQRSPDDAMSLVLLGLAYQQRARETGDPAYYTKSGGVLGRALTLDRKNYLVFSGLGSLALSRHRFRQALELGRQAHALSPTTARNYGVVGDALVELGRYTEAFAAFDRLATLRPGLPAYARVSYARELRGQTPGAIRAMKLAIDAAAAQPEANAWTHVQLGKIYWNHGRLAAAARQDREALAIFPGYAYGLDALAQVTAAQGHLRRAIALEQQAVDAIPLPQYVAALGDLQRVTGHPRLAQRQYALIGAIEKLLRANGVKTDLEIALFQADHGITLAHALERARIGQQNRPSIDGDDVLGWVLERTGHCSEALGYSRLALHLGTPDALKFFHRGMIERCLGNQAAASAWFERALALNPHFSLLWAPVARRYTT